MRGPAQGHCGDEMGNTAVPEHGAAVKSGDRIRYRVSTANSNGASIPIFALPNTIVVESATHSRIASIRCDEQLYGLFSATISSDPWPPYCLGCFGLQNPRSTVFLDYSDRHARTGQRLTRTCA